MKTQYLLTRLAFALVCLLHLVSCESELMVSAPGAPVSAITGLDRLSVKPGDEVVVSGRNLTTKITVDVGGKLADLKLSDKKSGSFILPDDTSSGLVEVIFKKGEIRLATFPLLNSDNLEDIPISVVPLASVCDSYIVKDKKVICSAVKRSAVSSCRFVRAMARRTVRQPMIIPCLKKQAFPRKF